MSSLLNKYATILTIVLFVISGLSGVLIFFHIGNEFLMGMHEWLSVGFVIAAVLEDFLERADLGLRYGVLVVTDDIYSGPFDLDFANMNQRAWR